MTPDLCLQPQAATSQAAACSRAVSWGEFPSFLLGFQVLSRRGISSTPWDCFEAQEPPEPLQPTPAKRPQQGGVDGGSAPCPIPVVWKEPGVRAPFQGCVCPCRGLQMMPCLEKGLDPALPTPVCSAVSGGGRCTSAHGCRMIHEHAGVLYLHSGRANPV